MITNFFKIDLPFDNFDIQKTDYSEEKLATFRTKHNAEASFFRHGDFIYISPAKGSSLQLGDTTRLSISEFPEVVESLIRHLIFRSFRDAAPERVPESFAPLRVISAKSEHDPIANVLPDDVARFVGFPRTTEVHVRSVKTGQLPVFGLVIYVRHRWRFQRTVAELHAEGFPLDGMLVLESVPVPGLSGIIAPDETLLGSIESVNGDTAIVTSNRGATKRRSDELMPQRSRSQLQRYLEFRLGKAHQGHVFTRIKEHHVERAKPARIYSEAVEAAKWFTTRKFENNDGFVFDVTRDSTFTDRSFRLEPTKLVFDYGPGASSPRPLSGLLSFGPFDSSRFDRKSLRLLAIFRENNRGAATKFLGQLIGGIPESKYFQKGLRDLFQLHDVQYVLKPITGSFAEDYEDAVDAAVKDSGGNKFDLALVECPDESRSFPEPHNPYLRAKARAMTYGIPVQCVRESHLRSPQYTLMFTLGPTALQIYAKVGGTPWLLPSSQSVDREVIIGIGNTIHRPNLSTDAQQSRIVGLTTLFLGDGRYILGHELRSVPYEEYFETLLQSLEESLTTVSQDYGWKQGDTVRIVFHVFKPLKNLEADVVEALVNKFSQFKIVYAFVTISTEHPWVMFSGVEQRQGSWQVAVSERGENLILDSHSCLLQLRGPKDRPNQKQRPPFPVLVRVHEKSTYRDLQFIAQQIHDFAYLSWRSFYPNETPVTVFYSELIADLSARLAQVKGWNPIVLDQHFRRKKWFL